MKPVALLGLNLQDIHQWAKRNLETTYSNLKTTNKIVRTRDEPFYYIIYNENQLVSIELSGFIVTDPAVPQSMINWAISRVRK